MEEKNTLDLLDDALLTVMGLLDAESVDFPRIKVSIMHSYWQFNFVL